MTTLPDISYLDSARTEGELKTGFYGPQLDVIKELPGGGESISTLAISSGSITPTAATHLVETEGSASTDDLSIIDVTNMPEGRYLRIRIVDDSREVVLIHEAGGTGQISLINSQNMTLSSTKKWVTLCRVGTSWVEINSTIVFSDLTLIDPVKYHRAFIPTISGTSSASERVTLSMPQMSVAVGNDLVVFDSDFTIDTSSTSNWDDSTYATAANRAGKDFYIYVHSGGVILSANSTIPTGYTATNSRK